jgi:membrane-associated phospholipid phosphatase
VRLLPGAVLFHGPVTASTTARASTAVRRRVAHRWMLTSGLSAAGLVGVYVVAVLTPTGQAMEDSILRSVDGDTLLQSGSALDAISPSALMLVVGVTMLVAFARRRPGAALQAGALVIGATVTTQVLKIVVPRPELTGDVYANSFPSGHTTVAVAAMFAVLTAFGRRSRPVVYVVATAFAAIVAEQTVAYGWHRCSDVVGACAVALLWLGVVRGVAARYTGDRRGRDESVGSKAHGVTSGVLGLALVVCLAASGATWGIGIGSDMSVTTSTGDGVLMGARLAAAGVVLVTGWLAWKLDRRL